MQRASFVGFVTAAGLAAGLLFASWSARIWEIGLEHRLAPASDGRLPLGLWRVALGPVGMPERVPPASAGDGPVVEQVVELEAKRFEFAPSEVTVKEGVPVVLELRTRDVEHGFSLPDFHVRTAVEPGKVSRVWFTPDRAETFTFLCDVYRGSGHEEMSGTLVVTGG